MPRAYPASLILCCRNTRPSSSCTGASGTGIRIAATQAPLRHGESSGHRSSARMSRGIGPFDRRCCRPAGGLQRSGNAPCVPKQGLQLFERALRHGCTGLGESSQLAIPVPSHPRTERMASHRKEDETAGAGFVLGCRHYLSKNSKLPSFAALRRVGRGAASEPKEQCADKGLPRHRRLGVPVSFILPSTRTPNRPAETTPFPSRPASQPQVQTWQSRRFRGASSLSQPRKW
jgi:hypothetical protein